MSDEGRTDYRHPDNVRVRVALFWLKNFFGNKDHAVITRADELLNEHNLGLDCWPSRGKSTKTTIDFPDRLVEEEDYPALRDTVFQILIGEKKHRDHCAVLFCNFRESGAGVTKWSTGEKTSAKCWDRPLCLVSPTPNKDYVTLLHEVGHGAHLPHDRTSTDADNRNFMHEAETRTQMYKWQILKMVGAFYAKKSK
jgi:hypothetical protein